MKSLLIIPLCSFTLFAFLAALLALCGVRFNPAEPLVAAFVSAAAGAVGMLPMIAAKRKDAVTAFQMALIGTILHLLTAVALVGTAIAAHVVSAKMSFVSWALLGYWVSLIALVWQLRRLLLTVFALPKEQH
jgi:hypothetical protein